jgi:uncharacterized protein
MITSQSAAKRSALHYRSSVFHIPTLFGSMDIKGSAMEVATHAEGWVLSVRAQPGARKNAVLGAHAGALKVAVTAAPEQGKANKAILEVLREALGLKRSQIEQISGETSRDKRFLIRDLSKDELATRLAALLQ